ncbi:DUF2628 domain-containing protein [Stenotrophomonas sp. PS02289]|uniref:DUF2628 domain-containing protein n=1 Tax=Stenotrophomonas sp. PS02289 TaxID=2991422 RepID=UPI002499FF4E|nr:DUF2628 domain-containing protein [Stenotrophomonas sp. PS02289]
MSSERNPVDDRPLDAAGNPYAAPDTELSDLPSEAEVAEAVSLIDRYPLLARAVDNNFYTYAKRWHLGEPNGRMARPWHWPALFFDVYWLLYRKMYLAALGFFGLAFIVGGVIALLPEFEVAALMVMLALKLALCVSANQLYRWHCYRLIARQQRRHPDQPERVQAEVRRRGGTSAWAVVLGLIVMGAINVLAEA